MRILVVDDDPGCRESYLDALQILGHQPVIADSVDAALSDFDAEPFPLVFSDIRMPQKSGVELLSELRSRRANSRPDVVLLTGFAAVETAVEALRHGAFDYLCKPVVIDDLARVIARWTALNPSRAGLADLPGDNDLYSAFIYALEVEKVYTDSELTLDAMARMIKTNRTTLSRIVNKRSPGGFTALLNSRRIAEFKLKATTGVSGRFTLEALAHSAGFPSKTSFFRIFRQEEGCTPREWLTAMLSQHSR